MIKVPMQFQRRPETAEAVQFDPKASQWPEEVRPWGRFAPRDMSWGFVETTIGTVHVQSGDWIVHTDDGKLLVIKDSIFQKIYEPTK